MYLQEKVKSLEDELALIGEEEYVSAPSAETAIRAAGRVKIVDGDESRYLGPSSGIAMTRLVMEIAKKNLGAKSIKEIVPEKKAQQIKDRFNKESSKPTSKIYPLISSVPAPNLPPIDLTRRLIEYYYKTGMPRTTSQIDHVHSSPTAQLLLPVLHEPTFDTVVDGVYQGSTRPYENFTTRMVIAISMQKLNSKWAGLADSYYLAALPFLAAAIKPMNIGTLQCFALIAQYSMVTPTRTASFWVVGLATRLCQALGITDEATISTNEHGIAYNVLEVDLRRRLFWIITSMEFGLAHSLGRPSALTIAHDCINVKEFIAVDDNFITPSGVLPGSPLSKKKLIAIHFFRMRLLQAEIRRKLYLKKRPTPLNDDDPWFQVMEKKLKKWLESIPLSDEDTALDLSEWFKVRYNTILIFLYRSSPQIPEPSQRAASLCFEAAVCNIEVQRRQIQDRSVDLTWIFTQTLFMALNTALWALSYPNVRMENRRAKVEDYLQTAQEGIYLASDRWPGVESALEIYDSLIYACLSAYDSTERGSSTPATSSPISTPSTVYSALTPGRTSETSGASPSMYGGQRQLQRSDAVTKHLPISMQLGRAHTDFPMIQVTTDANASSLAAPLGSTRVSLNNSFPSFQPNFIDNPEEISRDHYHSLDSTSDQFSQYFLPEYLSLEPLESLDQKQQSELMDTFERSGWSDMEDVMYQQSEDFYLTTFAS